MAAWVIYAVTVLNRQGTQENFVKDGHKSKENPLNG